MLLRNNKSKNYNLILTIIIGVQKQQQNAIFSINQTTIQHKIHSNRNVNRIRMTMEKKHIFFYYRIVKILLHSSFHSIYLLHPAYMMRILHYYFLINDGNILFYGSCWLDIHFLNHSIIYM